MNIAGTSDGYFIRINYPEARRLSHEKAASINLEHLKPYPLDQLRLLRKELHGSFIKDTHNLDRESKPIATDQGLAALDSIFSVVSSAAQFSQRPEVIKAKSELERNVLPAVVSWINKHTTEILAQARKQNQDPDVREAVRIVYDNQSNHISIASGNQEDTQSIGELKIMSSVDLKGNKIDSIIIGMPLEIAGVDCEEINFATFELSSNAPRIADTNFMVPYEEKGLINFVVSEDLADNSISIECQSELYPSPQEGLFYLNPREPGSFSAIKKSSENGWELSFDDSDVLSEDGRVVHGRLRNTADTNPLIQI